MKDRKYVVCRDDVYVGEVIRAHNIFRDVDCMDRQIKLCSWRSYRSMLFVLDDNMLSNDLLYRTKSYPILNLTDNRICLDLENDSIVINDACNLSKLLKYFGYAEELTYEDIVKIRNNFFTGKFAKDNCELFGFRETMVEDVCFYKYGREVVEPRELEKLREQFRNEQSTGHRMFCGNGKGPLPREYFDILDDRGDNTLMDVISGFDEKINAFRPHKEEGIVRKLKRY